MISSYNLLKKERKIQVYSAKFERRSLFGVKKTAKRETGTAAAAAAAAECFVLGSSCFRNRNVSNQFVHIYPSGLKIQRKKKMFTCIACTKPVAEDGRGEEGGARGSGTPSTKEAVKSLTSQIKDMALKMSGAYKQCKPCTSPSSYKKGQRPYPDFDAASEGVPYPYFGGGSSSSTPAWDFTTPSHNRGTRAESRFSTLYGGDRTPGGAESISAQSCDVVLDNEDESKEWMAQVEPGVHITFVSLPNGGNDLKRIRFSREMFNKWQAQRWWGENYDRITELYNVQRFNRQALHSPPRGEDEQRDSTFTRMESARESPMVPSFTPRNYSHHYHAGSSGYGMGGARFEASSFDAPRTTTSSRDEPSISMSNASDLETEWVEEDEPGVYITIRQLADGTKELRRVRFSREQFGEVHAKSWWEQNRERIQAQYL
ncbi:hypothetical protein OIU78_014017 [Salix suchowensis]|nr:hypothetical protein OIU78_014017 [Salix suchowensis]